MQSQNRFFDDLARVAAGAMGTLSGVKSEVETRLREQFERVLAGMDLVTRDEFEAVKAMAAKARTEQEDLARRLVEEIVSANDWAHDRASDEELVVEISGRWCEYRLYFVWQEEICAMHFSCGFDMKVTKGRRTAVYELLALANEKLWLGHFDLSTEDNSPSFRHALLLRGVGTGSAEQI